MAPSACKDLGKWGFPQRSELQLLSLSRHGTWYGKQVSPDLQTTWPQMAGER